MTSPNPSQAPVLLHNLTIFSALTAVTHVHGFSTTGGNPYRIDHTPCLLLAYQFYGSVGRLAALWLWQLERSRHGLLSSVGIESSSLGR